MRGEPHQPLRPDQRARLSDWYVVLAHVHSVSFTLGDQVRTVVEQEQRPMRGAHARKPTARRDDLLVACVLETKLHDADSTAQRRLQEAVVLLAADEVQTGRLQSACALEPVALRAFWCKLHAASLARHDVLTARTPQLRRQFGPNPPR